MNYRKARTLKNKIDTLVKKYNKITIEHGVANYEFSHYEFTEGNYRNKFEDTIVIYVVDFWNGEIIEYMTLTDEMLERPTEEDYEWGFGDFVSAKWDKRYPTLLEIREVF